jgi:hypothetical protein
MHKTDMKNKALEPVFSWGKKTNQNITNTILVVLNGLAEK